MSRESWVTQRLAVDGVRLGRRPRVQQRVDDGGRRVGGDEGAVDRADRGAGDDVGADAGLEQRLDHADLDRAADAAAAEHERDR